MTTAPVAIVLYSLAKQRHFFSTKAEIQNNSLKGLCNAHHQVGTVWHCKGLGQQDIIF